MKEIEYLKKYLPKDKLKQGLQKLKEGKPVQYIVGNVDFYNVNLLVNGTRENLEAIDKMIADKSKDWKVERMSGIDRNIVRLAIFEMNFSSDKLVPNIAINEAVELAKKFGTDESARFVNGILGSTIK